MIGVAFGRGEHVPGGQDDAPGNQVSRAPSRAGILPRALASRLDDAVWIGCPGREAHCWPSVS